MNILNKTVIIENINSLPYKSWISCGLPFPVSEQYLQVRNGTKKFPAYAVDRELFVKADMPAKSRFDFTIEPDPNPVDKAFKLSDWITDELHKVIPQFKLREAGRVLESNPIVPRGQNTLDFIELESANFARQRFHFRTRIMEANMTIEGWFDVFNGQDVIEWKVNATYGTVAPNQPRDRVFQSLSMVIGELPVIDFRVPKGLHAPVWYTDPRDQYTGIVWEAELATPNSWMRARTVENIGALLCLPPADRFAQVLQDPRVGNMIARLQFPLTSMYEDWGGKFGPLGMTPSTFPNITNEQKARKSRFDELLITPGDEYAPRRYAQPPNSGQTGEQADFGYARAEHAIILRQPWALHDLRYHAQAWKLRPYANREVTGDAVKALLHPNAKTYNLRPDERFSNRDMLGWPNPVGWISGYLTSDSQHRSDNLLFDLYLLTRDPSLKKTILDIIELEKLAYDAGEPSFGSGLGAPRGWGRVLFSWCKGLATGDFPEFEPMIHKMVTRAYKAASFRRLPDTAKVRVYSDREEKYGWFEEGTTTPIRCWLPWQEAIACVGFYAAYRMLNSIESRNLALIVAKTIVSYGFYQEGQQWQTAYGVRWRTDVEGEPLPSSSYTVRNPNYDVYTTGMHRWMLGAAKVLVDLDSTCLEADRARQIIAYYEKPTSWDDVCWWAV